MRRTLYLARHGETDWNKQGRWQGHTDVPLNEAGRRQASLLAERLMSIGGLRIARVVASDLSRARETAEIVARALGLGDGVVTLDVDLRERSFGVFEGLTREECIARHPDQWARYEATREPPPGGEEFAALKLRVVAAARRAAALAEAASVEGAVLVVSHGASIRGLVSHATGSMPAPLGNGAVFHAIATLTGFEDVRAL